MLQMNPDEQRLLKVYFISMGTADEVVGCDTKILTLLWDLSNMNTTTFTESFNR